jgi:hypothetical protein
VPVGGSKTGRVDDESRLTRRFSRRGHCSRKKPEPAVTVLRDREQSYRGNLCSETSEVQLKLPRLDRANACTRSSLPVTNALGRYSPEYETPLLVTKEVKVLADSRMKHKA